MDLLSNYSFDQVCRLVELRKHLCASDRHVMVDHIIHQLSIAHLFQVTCQPPPLPSLYYLTCLYYLPSLILPASIIFPLLSYLPLSSSLSSGMVQPCPPLPCERLINPPSHSTPSTHPSNSSISQHPVITTPPLTPGFGAVHRAHSQGVPFVPHSQVEALLSFFY